MSETRPQEAAPAAGSDTELPIDENQIIAERRAKLAALREAVAVPFPNDFVPADRADALLAAHDGKTREELEADNISVSVAGRMVLKRVQGKASFATLQDATGRIQLWMNDDGVGAEAHDAFKHWDLGDIVAAEGTLFKTKKGELSIRCTMVRLLTKSLRPLPDKFHGLADQEMRYRHTKGTKKFNIFSNMDDGSDLISTVIKSKISSLTTGNDNNPTQIGRASCRERV